MKDKITPVQAILMVLIVMLLLPILVIETMGQGHVRKKTFRA